MKRCLICGTDANDSALTCPACGEATWTAAVEEPKPAAAAEPSETSSDVEEVEPVRQGKRGRR